MKPYIKWSLVWPWFAIFYLFLYVAKLERDLAVVRNRADKALCMHGLHQSVFDGPISWEGKR